MGIWMSNNTKIHWLQLKKKLNENYFKINYRLKRSYCRLMFSFWLTENPLTFLYLLQCLFIKNNRHKYNKVFLKQKEEYMLSKFLTFFFFNLFWKVYVYFVNYQSILVLYETPIFGNVYVFWDLESLDFLCCLL